MKKLFLTLLALIIILIVAVYGVLFTSPGNAYVASLIESKVNEGQKDVNMKVNDFKLTMSEILFNATLDENSTINIEGDLNLLIQSADLKYDINIADLSKLENLTKQKLNGSFSTNGTIKGNRDLALLKGVSKIASSDTTYDIKIVDSKPGNIFLEMKNANIEELLQLANQPIYAKGKLDIDANIKSADVDNLDGTVTTKITNGILNAKTINKELEQEPKTPITFVSNTVTNLAGTQANTEVNLNSSIAKLTVKKANVDLKTSKVKSDYELFVKDMAQLESLINQKLNGSFSTKGDVTVEDGVIKVDGSSDIFASDTKYDIKVEDSKPEINLLVTKAKIESLLNLLNQPNYANGLMNIDAKIKSADIKNLDGKILTTILESRVNNAVVNEQFQQKLKSPILFKGDVTTDLVNTQAISKIDFNSSVSNLDIQKAVYDLEKAELTSDYTLDISDLSKLYDFTQMKMRGSAKVDGNIKQAKDLLSVDGKSSLFGGDITFNLLNDVFKANVDGVEIKNLTHMLYYPEFFTSKSNINIDYNLATKVGEIGGNLLNGQFIKSEYSDLINLFAQFDITKEIYEKVQINSNIKEDVLNTVVDMTSKHTTIKIPSSTINTAKNSIDAIVKANVLKYAFDTTIKGDLSNPKVSIDKNAFLKTKYGKKVKEKTDKLKEKVEEKLKKSLGDKFNLDNLLNENTTDKKKPTREEIAKAFKAMFKN